MEIRRINGNLSVSEQISESDVAEIAAAGFRSIICNRPDGEGPDQPVFAEIEKAARRLSLEARYMPVVSGKVRDEDAELFGKAMDELPKPIFAYCRTGTRSTTLWSLDQGARGGRIAGQIARRPAPRHGIGIAQGLEQPGRIARQTSFILGRGRRLIGFFESHGVSAIRSSNQ